MRQSLLRITLRQLQIFRAVCAHESYSRAADEMALTQPAVSLQIRQLEEQVGQSLFEYVGRKLYLTDAARDLLAASEDIFNRLSSLDMSLSRRQGHLQGTLRLAVASSIQYLVPHLLAAFQQRYPEVSFRVAVARHLQLIQRLKNNEDDLVLADRVPEDRSLSFFPFLNHSILLVARPDHTLAGKKALQLKMLEQYPLLQREAGSATRKSAEEFLQQRRIHPKYVMQLGSSVSLLQGVIAGLGIALVSAHSAAPYVRNGQLVVLDMQDLPLQRSWCSVHARSKSLSPVAETFMHFLQQERHLLRRLHADLMP